MYPATAILVCLECGVATDVFERGWRAYLALDDAQTQTDVVVLCPDCSEREFGEDAI